MITKNNETRALHALFNLKAKPPTNEHMPTDEMIKEWADTFTLFRDMDENGHERSKIDKDSIEDILHHIADNMIQNRHPHNITINLYDYGQFEQEIIQEVEATNSERFIEMFEELFYWMPANTRRIYLWFKYYFNNQSNDIYVNNPSADTDYERSRLFWIAQVIEE